MKKFELVGHVYVDSSNRNPIMVAAEEGVPMKERSLERYLKEAGIFPTLVEAGQEAWSKGLRFEPRRDLKKTRITITVEEI